MHREVELSQSLPDATSSLQSKESESSLVFKSPRTPFQKPLIKRDLF